MKFQCLWLVTALCLNASFSLAASIPPNIVLIMADDFGFECVAANGGQSYRTPNLDRLAATGMRFVHAHVQPLCTPTRVQLMTGQYNVRNYTEFGFMPPDSQTFANLFHDRGYATAIVGKWQLGADRSLPSHWGFAEHCLWQLTRRPDRYKNPGLEINGTEKNFTQGEYGPDIVNDYALDFITRHQSHPFLLYYPMMLTHDPFVPTPDHPDYEKTPPKNGKYFASMVTYADKLIGQLTDKLDALKLREKTLIIFLGDNGTHSSIISQFRGQDYQGGKGQKTGNGTHVPLIVNWPKTIPAGVVKNDLVDSTDVLPTICAAAGIKIPRQMVIDGQSFWPQLQGKTGSPRRWSYCWYAPRNQTLKFEFAQDLKFKLYRDGMFVEKINDQEERPLPEKLSNEARQSRIKLAKVLTHYREVRSAGLLQPKGTK